MSGLKRVRFPNIIENKIYYINNKKVMLDYDLAELYGVSVSRLNEQVKRNALRFPNDFMFQISKEDYQSLRSQFAISNNRRGGRRYLPYAFTEQGIAMLSSVLNSKKAILVNIEIMRTFVKLRKFLVDNKELAKKLKELEERSDKHDKAIHSIIEAIQQLITTPEKPKKRIGFHSSLSLK